MVHPSMTMPSSAILVDTVAAPREKRNQQPEQLRQRRE